MNTGKEWICVPLSVEIKNLVNVVNTIYHEYVPWISADEKILIFVSRIPTATGGKRDDNDNMNFEDIFISHRENNLWTTPVSLKKNNSKRNDAYLGLNPHIWANIQNPN